MAKEPCPSCGELVEQDQIVAHFQERHPPEVIGRASVKDISLPRPPTIPYGATKSELLGVAIGIFIIVIAFFIIVAVLTLFFNSTTVVQINDSMPLVVQLDSFLTGGWVVGFFYYWGSWEKALRASKNARRRLRGHPKDAVQFKSADLVKLWLQMEAREKELAPTQGLFVAMILGVMLFILSGIMAVVAILTYSLFAVQLTLEFLIGGVLVMALSWVLLRLITKRLREATDVALDWIEPSK